MEPYAWLGQALVWTIELHRFILLKIVTKICKCTGKRAFGACVNLAMLASRQLLSAMKVILSAFKCFLSNFNFRNSRLGRVCVLLFILTIPRTCFLSKQATSNGMPLQKQLLFAFYTHKCHGKS